MWKTIQDNTPDSKELEVSNEKLHYAIFFTIIGNTNGEKNSPK